MPQKVLTDQSGHWLPVGWQYELNEKIVLPVEKLVSDTSIPKQVLESKNIFGT